MGIELRRRARSVVAASDRRVKAVVGQVPFISGSQTFKELIRIDNWAALDAAFAGERQARFAGAEPTTLPVVDPDPTVSSALPTPDSYEWFTTTAEKTAPAWRNEVTLLSLEFLRAYEPISWIHLGTRPPFCRQVLVIRWSTNQSRAATELGSKPMPQ